MLDHYDRPTWPFHTTISNSRIEKRDKNHQTTPTYKEEERFWFEASNKRKDALVGVNIKYNRARGFRSAQQKEVFNSSVSLLEP